MIEASVASTFNVDRKASERLMLQEEAVCFVHKSIRTDAVHSKTQELRLLGIRWAFDGSSEWELHLVNLERSVRKAIHCEFGQATTRKDFGIAASKWESRPSKRKMSIAILGFFNFILDFYKTLGAFKREYSKSECRLGIFHFWFSNLALTQLE